MVGIKEQLEKASESEADVNRKEELLDELLEIVENIDNAKGSTISLPGLQFYLLLLQDCDQHTLFPYSEFVPTYVDH